MCTAITFGENAHFFGRTLDYEQRFGEEVVMVPRQFPLHFRGAGTLPRHYAMLGMAHVAEQTPLYFDAVNEKGLAMAGLMFQGNACYRPSQSGLDNIAPFALIPWVLGQCSTIGETRQLLQRWNPLEESFSVSLPLTPLHWMAADRSGQSIVIEAVREGVRIYDDPVGVMTNNPTFPQQLFQLSRYRNLMTRDPENQFAPTLPLDLYSRGMGQLGLPGDPTSDSRFVRAAFHRLHALAGNSREETVAQFFHILASVAQIRGCVEVGEGAYAFTQYTSCCDLETPAYLYTTHENQRITEVTMRPEQMDDDRLLIHPLRRKPEIKNAPVQ